MVAGARRDLGQLDAALAVLARGGLDVDHPRAGAVRLWYAYADMLEAAGRTEEAARWFAASAALDPEGELDAADRAAACSEPARRAQGYDNAEELCTGGSAVHMIGKTGPPSTDRARIGP